MKKHTMQDIADELNISRVSVWKVFNNQEGVSDSLKKQVIDTARELGYNKLPTKMKVTKEKTICLIVSRPDSSIFWTNIIHDLAEKLSTINFRLIYVSIPTRYYEGYKLPSDLNKQNYDGAIILNIYDSKLLRMISEVNLPKVYLDSTTDITGRELKGDLLVIEGHDTVSTITNSLIEKGLKKIGFIGDISYAKTNYDRFSGYLHSLKTHDLAIDYDYCLTENIDIYSYSRVIFSFLEKLPKLPEAFVCASDFVAHFIYDYLAEKPEKVKSSLTITGFDGTNEYTNVVGKITTAYVDTASLGIRLAKQIEYRVNNDQAPYEVSYIYPVIKYVD